MEKLVKNWFVRLLLIRKGHLRAGGRVFTFFPGTSPLPYVGLGKGALTKRGRERVCKMRMILIAE